MYKDNQNPLLICFCSKKIFLSGSAGVSKHPLPRCSPLPLLLAVLSVWMSLFLAKLLHTCRHMPCSSFNCSSVSVLRSRERRRSSKAVGKGCVSVTGRCQVPDGQRWAVCVRACKPVLMWTYGDEGIEQIGKGVMNLGRLEVTTVGTLSLTYIGCNIVHWREKTEGM